MKIIKNILIPALLTTIVLSSCNNENDCIKENGNIITKTLSLDPVIGFRLYESADIIINQGDKQEIKVTGSQNIIDRLKTGVTDSIWNIEFGKECFDYGELTIEMTIPKINYMSIVGTGNIKVKDFEDNGDMDISSAGNADIEINSISGIYALDIIISGTCNVDAIGNISSLKKFNINISGTGNVRAYPVITRSCIINIPGTGNCYVNVIENLEVNISGTGNVYYKGHPEIDENISGTGKIHNMN
jgi:hypothetical protein